MSAAGRNKRVTTKVIREMKRNGEKIAVLTAYDFLFAKIIDACGIDIALVGDSLSNVYQGNETTLPVTLDEMIYHTKTVCRAVQRAMIVVDMPFMSYQASEEEALRNAGRVLKETSAQAVKLEGGRTIAATINRMVNVGIPVMGHLGLTPQSIHSFGSYDVQAKQDEASEKLISDAHALQDAGVFSIVLEKIPAKLAAEVSAQLEIPTIGIGAGVNCDGQVLVLHDMLGLNQDFHPKFVRHYAEGFQVFFDAVTKYIQDVKKSKFPSQDESY